MIKTTIEVNTNEESWEVEKKLKETGYTKTADCYWTKIYSKGNIEIIINRA